jgi:hypothetical protein
VATVIVSFEIGWGSFAAQIAIDALIIDIKLSRNIFSVFVSGISHILSVNSGTEGYEERSLAQRILLRLTVATSDHPPYQRRIVCNRDH